jgi:hypothetical protein
VLDQLRILGSVLDDLAQPVTFDEVAIDDPVVESATGGLAAAEVLHVLDIESPPAAPGRRVGMRIALCAAVVLAVVAAAIALENRAPTDTASGTAADAASDVGVFPSGGVDGAVAAGYTTPTDVVRAYMADRTDPAHLPPDYTITATVGAATPSGADTAVVGVSLQTPDDSGDLLVAVRRVGDPPVWQVTAATIFTDELRDITMTDGVLSGDIAPQGGGTTYVSAHDISTGAVLDSAVVTLPLGDGDSTTAYRGPFTLETGNATVVSLQYWNVVDPVDAYAYANFTEVPVSVGEGRFGSGWDDFVALRPPDAPVMTTLFVELPATSATSVDAASLEIIPAGSDLRVSEALPGVGSIEVYDTPDRRQVCMKLELDNGGQVSGSCDDRTNIDSGQSYAFMGDAAASGVVMGIASVDIGLSVTVGDTVVAPDEHGVWYALVPPGTTEFTMTTSEGSRVISIPSL